MEQHLPRSHRFSESQGQQLGNRVGWSGRLCTRLLESRGSFLSPHQIEARAQLAKSVCGAREIFDGVVRERERIGTSQIVMSASAAISIAEQIKNRNAAAQH